MTAKQTRVLKTIEWFIPNKDWYSHEMSYNLQAPQHKYEEWDKKEGKMIRKEKAILESNDGADPITSFFMYTERGNAPEKVKGLIEFIKLVWGHRRMTLHEKMWREGFEEGILYPSDFNEDPEYIQKIAQRSCEMVGRKWL